MAKNNLWETLGTITRYLMAGIACVWFAQFLLVVGIRSEKAQTLAVETLARALLCGFFAALWFYTNRKKRNNSDVLDKKQVEDISPHPQVEQKLPPIASKIYCNSCGVDNPADSESCSKCGNSMLQPVTGEPQLGTNTTQIGKWVVLAAFYLVVIIFFTSAFLDRNKSSSEAKLQLEEASPSKLFEYSKYGAESARVVPSVLEQTTNSDCPPNIPTGVKTKLLSPEQSEKMIGTGAKLDWNEYVRLRLLNGTAACVTSAEVEIHLQEHHSLITEHHLLVFTPILAAGKESSETVTLRRKKEDGEDPLSIQEWRVTKVWGFNYPTESKPVQGGLTPSTSSPIR